ncbi:hypothetical protein G7K_6112-t1 [Saitoella complicata NRRL Y-17804]|uniref:Uncharacterized protein n=1 Tax=Saitoella complicata (strain BCRC 22490 / CBS 7301 / JCM 7358 / NBRC 10748 / NRRL Y-17804) TaxID=698492 RepID=A0A0E9NQA4_SAICN|nr:hypothetical protein G7K_6112-t1 [Saitoella complicata NRRL Y-17804]
MLNSICVKRMSRNNNNIVSSPSHPSRSRKLPVHEWLPAAGCGTVKLRPCVSFAPLYPRPPSLKPSLLWIGITPTEGNLGVSALSPRSMKSNPECMKLFEVPCLPNFGLAVTVGFHRSSPAFSFLSDELFERTLERRFLRQRKIPQPMRIMATTTATMVPAMMGVLLVVLEEVDSVVKLFCSEELSAPEEMAVDEGRCVDVDVTVTTRSSVGALEEVVVAEVEAAVVVDIVTVGKSSDDEVDVNATVSTALSTASAVAVKLVLVGTVMTEDRVASTVGVVSNEVVKTACTRVVVAEEDLAVVVLFDTGIA